MAPSYRRQTLRSSALTAAIAAGLFCVSYVLAPSLALVAALAVGGIVVLIGVYADVLDDRFGLVWLGFLLAAAVVYLSGTTPRLRQATVMLMVISIGSALLWFVPAKAAALGERMGERFRS